MSDDHDIIDWAHFERYRTALGRNFIRVLGYFREDGAKAVEQIEAAMHEQNTVALVIPAYSLKEDSRQVGARPLAEVAEEIETVARFCVESHRFPDELVSQVVELRRLFEQAVRQLDSATNPLRSRPSASGARA